MLGLVEEFNVRYTTSTRDICNAIGGKHRRILDVLDNLCSEFPKLKRRESSKSIKGISYTSYGLTALTHAMLLSRLRCTESNMLHLKLMEKLLNN